MSLTATRASAAGTRFYRCAPVIASAAWLAACGSGGGGGLSSSPAPPPPTPAPPPFVFPAPEAQFRVSGPSGFAAGCDNAPATGTLFADAEVEPHIAVNPANAMNLIGVWQQNRFSNGAAQGLIGAYSNDGGATWTRTTAPLSRCTGGNAGNGGDYARATDPWVTFAPDGTAYWMSLSITGASFSAGSANAMLVARSIDGGQTWGNPTTLIRDGATFFNDKNAITADPTDANFAYAVWDRLGTASGGPAMLARTTNAGATWEAARAIFDPGASAQTIGNVVAVVAAGAARGTVVNLYTRLTSTGPSTFTARLEVLRSTDKGLNWSAPIVVGQLNSVGAFDPQNRTAVRDGSDLGQIAAAPNGDLYVVWQDARFTGGQIDAIALSRSTDGGLTWSAPVRVNSVPNSQAFTPSVTVRADGTVGVSYYDFRSDTTDPSNLPTEYWLARSIDNGLTWSEVRVAGPFDLALAPNALGLFLGDYQGLTSSGTSFVPLFAQTTRDGPANRNDIFAKPIAASSFMTADSQRIWRAETAPPAEADGPFRARVSANLKRLLDARVAERSAPLSKFPVDTDSP